MMKKLILSLAALIGLSIIVANIGNTITEYNNLPVQGQLGYQINKINASTYTVGQFDLVWDHTMGGALKIYHQADPQNIIWSTIPGTAFVSAAQGVETVTESRGSFFIEDDIQLTCTAQTLDNIKATTDNIQLSGNLTCNKKGETVGYTLTFSPQGANQLGFNLTLSKPTYNRLYLTYVSQTTEKFFGFGEQFSFFNFKGRRLPIFVMEQGVGRGAEPIITRANLSAKSEGDWHTTYAGVPYYISSRLHALFLENYEYVVFNMTQPDLMQIELFAPQMTGRILYGQSPADLIAEYTQYAGRMRALPDWILSGAIVGMQGGTEKVQTVLKQLQNHNTPIAAFWLQDWVGQRTTSLGKQLWWNWELDEDHYPAWEQLVADLEKEDIKVLTYINPFLADVSEKNNHQRNLFKEAESKGFLIQTESGEPYLIQNSSFSAGLVDLTNPAARTWLKEIIKTELITTGASGWLADYGESLPYDAHLFSKEAPTTYHNKYPEEWAKLNREAIEESGQGDNMVFFSRSAYRQSPQYSTLFWLGDQMVSWDEHDGIKTAVTGLLSSGLSGFSFNHSDIGGYTTITNPLKDYHRSKELLWRWMELNAFTTIYRTHEGNNPEVNHQFYSDEESLAQFSRFAKVYQAWGFYRKQLVQEAAETGLPVVRHPFIHYPDDPVFHYLTYEQFMVGSEFMVAPVLDPDTEEVVIYLPAGEWVHVWSGQSYGTVDTPLTITVAAPLGEPAVFYKAGSEVGEQFVANLQEMDILK